MTDLAESSLRRAELEWQKAWTTRDLEALVAPFADDAVLLATGRPVVSGRPAIREVMSEITAMRGLEIDLALEHVVVSEDGSLGYSIATYTTATVGADGERRSHPGKYVAVWRRDGNEGPWRIVLHSSSMSGPLE